MTWPDLVEGEVRITNRDEKLRRQIRPEWVQEDGTVGSQTFKDGRKQVSVTRDAVITAAEARIRHPNPTVGSCVVLVSDVDDCDLRAIDDSNTDGVLIGHSYIDLRKYGSSAMYRKALALKGIANENGITNP